MLTREAMEEREARQLAPYAMRNADSRGRVHDEREHALRTAYQRDRERIIHSTAFRRMQYKTQVFVNHEGDHYRTRLTHTTEVAQIARAAARVLNVNEDLTEAVALAHDIGHTPFGHSGEDALRELMNGHGGFEHNTHGLRVVDVLEHCYPSFRGLNLTWEVRESIVKHVTSYDHPALSEFEPDLRPLIEAQIVEAADGIAYNSHDLDDALAAGILDADAYAQVGMLRKVVRDVGRRIPNLPPDKERHEVVRALINLLVSDLCESTLARIRDLGIQSVGDVRSAPANLVAFSEGVAADAAELEKYLFANVYQHYRVARMTNKAKHFVKELFGAFIEQPRQLPPFYQAWVREQGPYQGVCDYIAGMTDRYAQDEYRRLFTPFERV